MPLAAVLWNGGISFGGVIAFIFADLIILPILNIYRKYYGRRMAGFLFVTFYATMAAAGLIVELLFQVLGLDPTRAQRQGRRRRRHLELHDRAQHRLPGARRGARRALLPQRRRLAMLRMMNKPIGEHRGHRQPGVAPHSHHEASL